MEYTFYDFLKRFGLSFLLSFCESLAENDAGFSAQFGKDAGLSPHRSF